MSTNSDRKLGPGPQHKDNLEIPLPAGYQPKQPYQEPARGPLPVYRTLEWTAHKDPQIELVLGLEAMLAQAEENGATQDDVTGALDYVVNRSRHRRPGVVPEPYPAESDWPQEGELPPGPYNDPAETC